MKKIISFALLLVMVFSALTLISCSPFSEDDQVDMENFLLMQPSYVGDPVTDTQHTFVKEDFKVLAIYKYNLSEELTDFSFEVLDLKDGKYTIAIRWKNIEEQLRVPLQMAVYPSETTAN